MCEKSGIRTLVVDCRPEVSADAAESRGLQYSFINMDGQDGRVGGEIQAVYPQGMEENNGC